MNERRIATDLLVMEGLVEALANALASYYAGVFDGPETDVPLWVIEGREALADALVGPNADFRRREEAVALAIANVNKTKPTLKSEAA